MSDQTACDHAAVIAAYIGGEDSRQVAERFGISPVRVLQILGEHQVPKRGRRSHYGEADCLAALDAAAADGVRGVHRYIVWSKDRDVPSWGTIRNHGYGDRAMAVFANSRAAWTPPQAWEVQPIEAPTVKTQPIVEWLFANGTESIKALGEYADQRFRCDTNLPARRRGRNLWSLSVLDQFFPDRTCPPATRKPPAPTPPRRPRQPRNGPGVRVVQRNADSLTVVFSSGNRGKRISVPAWCAEALFAELDEWLEQSGDLPVCAQDVTIKAEPDGAQS